MIDLVATIALSLIPVLLMLLFWQHRRKTLVHPHFLLVEDSGSKSRSFRIARPRLYADTILDAATAIGIACVFVASGLGLRFDPKTENLPTQAPIPRFLAGDEAIVLDLSRSMLHGDTGSRPLDLAVASIMEEKPKALLPEMAGSSRIFGLYFDPHVQKSRLIPLEPYLQGDQNITSSIRIASTFPFLTPEYRTLASMRRQGFSRIRLFSDGGVPHIRGIHIESFGQPPAAQAPDMTAAADPGTGQPVPSEEPGVSWPARILYDRTLERYVIHLVEKAPGSEPSLYQLVSSRKTQGSAYLPSPLSPTEWDLEPLPGGAKLTVKEPGLYLLRARRAGSEQSFPFYLAPSGIGFSASGPLSEAIAGCLPYLEPSSDPQIFLLDASAAAASRKRKGQAQVYRIVTDTGTGGIASPQPSDSAAGKTSTSNRSRECRAFLGPATTGGSLVPVEFSDSGKRTLQADFVLGPASLASDSLILAYDATVGAVKPAAYLESPLRKASAGPDHPDSAMSARGNWQEFGEGWILTNPQGPRILLPDASEYFPSTYRPGFGLPRRSPHRLPWAIGFAIIAALKIALQFRKAGSRSRTSPAPQDTQAHYGISSSP